MRTIAPSFRLGDGAAGAELSGMIALGDMIRLIPGQPSSTETGMNGR